MELPGFAQISPQNTLRGRKGTEHFPHVQSYE